MRAVLSFTSVYILRVLLLSRFSLLAGVFQIREMYGYEVNPCPPVKILKMYTRYSLLREILRKTGGCCYPRVRQGRPVILCRCTILVKRLLERENGLFALSVCFEWCTAQ